MTQEVYKKVGRGGAGNFYSKQDVERSNGISDLENQSSSSGGNATKSHKNPSLISQAMRGAGPPPEYQHTGRGGAGNYTSPASLLSSGLTQTTTNHENPTINPAPPSSSPRNVRSSMQSVVYKGGRGGAGNYDFESDEARISMEENARREREREREREKEREIEKMVVGDVDGEGERGLRKPGRTFDIHAGKEMEGHSKGRTFGGVLE
ncbi:hypothetical protein NHQ30_005214 [Ciborinia camelliae]|nr:hypothetical protein NHQ30_005214 [Ciborinia camelliae]